MSVGLILPLKIEDKAGNTSNSIALETNEKNSNPFTYNESSVKDYSINHYQYSGVIPYNTFKNSLIGAFFDGQVDCLISLIENNYSFVKLDYRVSLVYCFSKLSVNKWNLRKKELKILIAVFNDSFEKWMVEADGDKNKPRFKDSDNIQDCFILLRGCLAQNKVLQSRIYKFFLGDENLNDLKAILQKDSIILEQKISELVLNM